VQLAVPLRLPRLLLIRSFNIDDVAGSFSIMVGMVVLSKLDRVGIADFGPL
jgi:hypothetical protein